MVPILGNATGGHWQFYSEAIRVKSIGNVNLKGTLRRDTG